MKTPKRESKDQKRQNLQPTHNRLRSPSLLAQRPQRQQLARRLMEARKHGWLFWEPSPVCSLVLAGLIVRVT
jgi:hypothetical protein